MLVLAIGLLLFFAPHSLFILANDWRLRQQQALGVGKWKLLFALVSIVGLVLIVVGYGEARTNPTWLWHSPMWLRHPASLLILVSFVLLAATYVPANHIKQKMGHPMLIATKTWAFAHLLVNGTLADVVLFGSFMVWAVVGFRVARLRTKAAGVQPQPANVLNTLLTVVIGVVGFAGVTFYFHELLIGVAPFPAG